MNTYCVDCLCLDPRHGGDSIKCWVCRSDGDPKCADPFDNTSFPIADCRTYGEKQHLPGLKPTMCRKIRQKINGNWRYIRGCAWLGEPGIGRDERYCIHRSGTYNVHMEYCTCRSKDGCNSAPAHSAGWGLPMAFATFSLLFTCKDFLRSGHRRQPRLRHILTS